MEQKQPFHTACFLSFQFIPGGDGIILQLINLLPALKLILKKQDMYLDFNLGNRLNGGII